MPIPACTGGHEPHEHRLITQIWYHMSSTVPKSYGLGRAGQLMLQKCNYCGPQVVDDARDLVGGRDDGGFGTEASPHPPVVGPQAVVAATDRLRREQ